MEAKDRPFYPKHTLKINGRLLCIDEPWVMGILNLSGDSFYADSRVTGNKALLSRAGQMLREGARILDIGAFSSRPGSALISDDDQLQLLLPAIQTILAHHEDAIISIDTCSARVAAKCIDAGAAMINDISGGEIDAQMFSTIAGTGVPYVLMHMQGIPQTMQNNPVYDNVVSDIQNFFATRVRQLRELGHHDIILDPGFGFGKTIEHNYQLLHHLDRFCLNGMPLLAGISRKSMIYKVLSCTPEEALNGTTALHMAALVKGASILRVHDVREACEVVELFKKMSCEVSGKASWMY